MKTREEQHQEVILKLNIAPEVVKMYEMRINDNQVIINNAKGCTAIKLGNQLEVKEEGNTYEFVTWYGDKITSRIIIWSDHKKILSTIWTSA